MSYDKIAVLNGHFRPVREVRLNPTSSGILSGWAIYTTVRIYDGLPFNVDAHVTRLRKDAARMSIPFASAIENLGADLTDLARRNHVESGRGRVMLLAGEEDGKPTSNLLLLTSGLLDRPEAESVWVAPYRVHTSSPLIGVKLVANALYTHARREASKNRFDEALFLNERDEVVEVSSGNPFWVRNGVLRTPALDCGGLDGTSRGIVRRLAADLEIPIEEGAYRLDDLLAADEAFVASVSREVAPVARIGETEFSDTLGPIGRRLHDAFRAHVDAWHAETRAALEAEAEADATGAGEDSDAASARSDER